VKFKPIRYLVLSLSKVLTVLVHLLGKLPQPRDSKRADIFVFDLSYHMLYVQPHSNEEVSH